MVQNRHVQGGTERPLFSDSVQKQENDKIPCDPKTLLTRGTERPFRCLDFLLFTWFLHLKQAGVSGWSRPRRHEQQTYEAFTLRCILIDLFTFFNAFGFVSILVTVDKPMLKMVRLFKISLFSFSTPWHFWQVCQIGQIHANLSADVCDPKLQPLPVNEGNFPKMLNNIVDNEVDTVTYEQICGT